MLRLNIFISVLLFATTTAIAQRGSLGNLSVGAQDTWVNTYTDLTSDANIGDMQLTVSNNTMSGLLFPGNLDEGDLILIIQMQGATPDISTFTVTGWLGTYTVQNSFFGNGNVYDPTEFGQVTNYNNSGNFEYVEVSGVSGGNIIELNCGLTKNYTAAGHVQIVRVPRFEDLTVPNNTSITAPTWNGTSGGVVAVEVNGDLTLTGTGTITADEIGFRGGVTESTSTQSCNTTSSGYLGSFDAQEGAEKGEGIGGFYTEYDNLYSRYCYGAIGNGGGGANYHNAGGGGGANVGVGTFYGYGVPDPAYAGAWNQEDPTMVGNPSSGGGRGGYSNAETNNDPFTTGPNNGAWNGDCRRTAGGTGGHALTYDPDRIFMGGGGGAGEENNNFGGNGGRGGGIVMLQVYGNITGTGSITANGQDGEDAFGPAPGFGGQTGDDGAGGAGGGGAIHISHGNAIPAGIDLNAIGGNGGDQSLQFHFANTGNQADGPGGAGAGGMISYSSGTPTENVGGGIAGTTNSSIVNTFPQNGATDGASGMNGLTNNFFDLQVENDTICGGGTTTLTATVIGTLPSGGTIEWYDSQSGGTNVNSGANFTTPSLATTTTYYVGVCPGTFRLPVEVVVSPAINISGPPTITPETCTGNDGAIIGLTASGGFGALTFDWNGTVTPTEDLTNAVGGNYTLTVTDENGCTETSGPHTIVPSPGPTIDLSGINIQNETCLGNDGSITGIVASGSNITIEWNGNVEPDEDITGLSAGSYTLVVTDDASCTTTAGPFTINADPGPSIDDSNINIEDETCFGDDGEITGIVATGTNLTFEWNGNVTLSEDTVGLAAGSYTLVVTDGVGCTATSGPYTVNAIPGPTVDDSNIDISDEGCNQGNGSITGITASGNNLSYVWNGTVEPGPDLTGLSAGNYTLEVVDDLGCTVTVGPYTVQNIPGPVIDISNMVIEDVTCNGIDGSITGITSSGSGLTFEWNGNSSPTIDLINVSSGNYGLQVTDGNGCTQVAGPFTIDSLPSPTIDDNNLTVIQESCSGNDGSISGLQVTGNGLTFEWNGQTTATEDLTNIPSDDYTLVVTDANGCTVNYGPVTVGGSIIPTVNPVPNSSIIDLGESVDLNANINPTGSTVSWSPSTGLSCDDCENPTATPEQSGWYTVIVTSADGCTAIDSVFIEVEDPCGEIMLPTVFSPNDDGLNDKLCILGGCVQSMNLQIFNRWGEKIFESNAETDCWDGTFKGQKVNTGTFIYKLNGTRTDGSEFNFAGNLNVIR